MKKLFFFAMVAFAGLTYTSCTPEDINGLLGQVTGDATLTITCDSTDVNFYNNGDTVQFSSCITDFYAEDTVSVGVFLSANINLLEAQAISSPYMAYALTDTVPGSYPVTTGLSLEDMANISNFGSLITGANNNIFLLVANDTAVYLGKSGNIVLTQYANFGGVSEGTFSNVECYYITDAKAAYLKNLVNDANAGDVEAIQTLQTLTLDDVFATITVNGSFNGRRIAAQALINTIGAVAEE